jgi:hypothetical protein
MWVWLGGSPGVIGVETIPGVKRPHHGGQLAEPCLELPERI